MSPRAPGAPSVPPPIPTPARLPARAPSTPPSSALELAIKLQAEHLQRLHDRVTRLEKDVTAARPTLADTGALTQRADRFDERLAAHADQALRVGEALEALRPLAARVDALELELRWSQPAPAPVDRLEPRIAELEARLEMATRREAELHARVDALEAARVAGPPPAARRDEGGDDLRRIKGIGPVFERALRDNGISSYRQIAAWTPEDVASIAPRIGARPERITKDGWIASARALMGPTASA